MEKYFLLPLLYPQHASLTSSRLTTPPLPVRLVLNYKNIPYTTRFIEYPDLEPELSALGLAPNAPGTAFKPYSSPTILLPSSPTNGKPEPLMNSLPIVARLESLYPSPPLHLSSNLHLEAEKVVEAAAVVVWWDGMANMLTQTLTPRAAEYFDRTRKEIFGAGLEELARVKGGGAGWVEAEREGGVLEGLRDFLKNHKKDGRLALSLADRFCSVWRAVGVLC